MHGGDPSASQARQRSVGGGQERGGAPGVATPRPRSGACARHDFSIGSALCLIIARPNLT
jgi:hypothetical protein